MEANISQTTRELKGKGLWTLEDFVCNPNAVLMDLVVRRVLNRAVRLACQEPLPHNVEAEEPVDPHIFTLPPFFISDNQGGSCQGKVRVEYCEKCVKELKNPGHDEKGLVPKGTKYKKRRSLRNSRVAVMFSHEFFSQLISNYEIV
ncbi:hypothetical protein, unlikely [Trypanosoma congolense IL3000]|uniref:Uncharacterized protein n=1 Tax=Trypanosoma congolense (strain IL3000) TaxID=1068625 RepID=F9WCR9_TRYCI|nr:hypothetical protein, unlikely [Trypanosoma congolense IL3000]